MYLQRMINALKYAQAPISNYATANIRLLNLRKGIFTTHLSQSNQRISYENYNKQNSSQVKLFVLSSTFLFNLFKPKEEQNDVETLKTTIKRSILLIQQQEFQKAEVMLHVALQQAQTLGHDNGITYVFDLMANLAYETNDFEKAEKLFISVLQRLMSKGTSENDLAVIHVSLKLADIYHKKGDLVKAENGYLFCLHHLHEHMAKDSESPDVLQLLGITLEWYASFLFSQFHYTKAHKYFTQAYNICIKLNGEEHEETIILLSNLGSVSYMLQKYDEAITYLSKALKLGEKFPDMDELATIHINLGNTYFEKGLYEQATQGCNEGKKLAEAKENKNYMEKAEECLKRIKSVLH